MNSRTMVPTLKNNAAVGYQGPVKIELLKSTGLLKIPTTNTHILMQETNEWGYQCFDSTKRTCLSSFMKGFSCILRG